MSATLLDDVVGAQKRGEALGITSICSANTAVLSAALQHAKDNDLILLIESTCNQVNQFGGYTGQTPADFMAAALDLARRHDFPPGRLLLGGDHLGPFPWREEPAEQALEKASALVSAYASAGYTKIHLDASMPCADDGAVSVEEIAERTADLAQSAENAALESGLPDLPRYIIGSEVPAAGGTAASEDEPPAVTLRAAAAETITATRAAFAARGLEAAWERVAGLVVQPGVEYGSDSLFPYDRAAAHTLSTFIESEPNLVYEAHSTDYQTREALRDLVRDHFAILKVGPALTFAYREAVFALAAIEQEWLNGRAGVTLSGIRAALERAMLDQPAYWQPYYEGSRAEQHFARQYSLSDRIRYYWPVASVQAALARLEQNLSGEPIPRALFSQYLPRQFDAMCDGRLSADPQSLIAFAVTAVLDDYAFACGTKVSAQ